MNYSEYLSSCMKFAKDTMKWGNIDICNFYTTQNGISGTGCDDAQHDGWVETCDNYHGGIGVEWAFHKRVGEIRQEAPERYAQEIINLFMCMMESGAVLDDLYSVEKYFESKRIQ